MRDIEVYLIKIDNSNEAFHYKRRQEEFNAKSKIIDVNIFYAMFEYKQLRCACVRVCVCAICIGFRVYAHIW